MPSKKKVTSLSVDPRTTLPYSRKSPPVSKECSQVVLSFAEPAGKRCGGVANPPVRGNGVLVGGLVAKTPAPPRSPATVTEEMVIPHLNAPVAATALAVVLLVPAGLAPAGTAYRLPASIMIPANAVAYLVELIGNGRSLCSRSLMRRRRRERCTDWADAPTGLLWVDDVDRTCAIVHEPH